MVNRTKEQRLTEIKPIINKLTELKVNAADHSEIKELLTQIQVYIQQGERIEINIPFPIADVDIQGVLATDVKERVWLKFTRGETPRTPL
jgi:hypothetical protein